MSPIYLKTDYKKTVTSWIELISFLSLSREENWLRKGFYETDYVLIKLLSYYNLIMCCKQGLKWARVMQNGLMFSETSCKTNYVNQALHGSTSGLQSSLVQFHAG